MESTESTTPLTSSEARNNALNMTEVSLGPTNLLNAPGFEPTAPGTGVLGALSSARTSFTRVGLDDEAPASHDRPSTSLSEPRGPANEAIDNSTSTSSAAILPMEAPVQVEQPPTTAQEVLVPQTPQTFITFLLLSGRRRTMSFDPETTIGRVKELAWNGWPGDWQDERPPAPSYLRILYLGKMLQDDDTLTSCVSFAFLAYFPRHDLKLPTHTPQPTSNGSGSKTPPPTATIVHLSIRPYAPPGDGDALKKKKRGRAGEANNSPTGTNGAGDEQAGEAGCCGCVIC